MNANEYQILAMRTKGNTFTNRELMVNAALGIAGETAEYLESLADNNIDGCKKELGDIEWYIALMCDVFKINFSALTRHRSNIKGKVFYKQLVLPSVAGRICDQAKKVYFQGHSMSRSDMYSALIYLQDLILDICDESGFDIEEIWELNIDKLFKRYPGGFKVRDSVNRKGEDQCSDVDAIIAE